MIHLPAWFLERYPSDECTCLPDHDACKYCLDLWRAQQQAIETYEPSFKIIMIDLEKGIEDESFIRKLLQNN
jgi:hypothetical protein